MSKAVKIKVYKIMVKPVVYVIKMDVKRLSSWGRKILRRIGGSVVQEGIWRSRTNQELRELYEYLDIVVGFKKEDWNELSIVKMGKGWTGKVMASKPEGSRSGITLSLLEDVEKDLQ
jgi:hypothetical protein